MSEHKVTLKKNTSYKRGDIVTVLVNHPLGAENYESKGKTGVIIRACLKDYMLNDKYLYSGAEIRLATEKEKEAFIIEAGENFHHLTIIK